ncbi:hypothetical protein BH11PLA2_BH11PLA2_09680 [soil metagenome]
MTASGPDLERLLQRLAECPPDFLLKSGEIDHLALVCDHHRALGVAIPNAAERTAFNLLPEKSQHLIAVTLWLLRDDWFLGRPDLAIATMKFLLSESLAALASLVSAETIVNDPDRREELIRLCLKTLGIQPHGESTAQAADRLATLDSVERQRVILKTRNAEARAREIREAMTRQRATEAAARYSPE